MNESIQVVPMLKWTGSHADVFAAVGLADLLASIPDAEPIRIVELSSEFQISAGRPLTDADWPKIPQAPGYPFLKANEKVSVPQRVNDFVDYKAEKAKSERRKLASRSKKSKGGKRTDTAIEQLVEQDRLRDDWRLLQVLNALQGDETANEIHKTIVEETPEAFHSEMGNAIRSISQHRPTNLRWNARTVQIFTPVGAKGYGRLKPDSTDRNDKTKEQWVDPFVDWLKYRGYFQIACPFFQGSKAENVQVLCPVPADISLRALASLARKLRTAGVYGSTPKVDALSALKLAELVVRHSEEYHDPDGEVLPGLSLRGKTAAEVISGIMVTFYQSLGTAKAVSAMYTLALPGWFRIETPEDARDWIETIDEHRRIVLSLNPGDREVPPKQNSDEIGLLILYRRFLEARGENALWALLEFMGKYGPFVMRANGTKQDNRVRWIPRFTDHHFRRVLMGTETCLIDIANDPGFEAVAQAVRQATVGAQHRRAQNKEVWREIRYELLHDLHRTRKVPGNAFVERVMEFVSRYNYENARRRETKNDPKAAPPNVADDELKSFLTLVDLHGASVVGALLAAYGSCKEKWEGDDKGPSGTASGEAEPAGKIEKLKGDQP